MASETPLGLSWSHLSRREHETFVRILETQSPEPSENTWEVLAAALEKRSISDLKVHAMRYMCALLDASPRAPRFPEICGETDESGWSVEESVLFEQAAAFIDDEDPQKWRKIAQILPGRSPEDVRMHYEELLLQMLIADGDVES